MSSFFVSPRGKHENRLTSITVGANTTTYAYDGDGNRVKKTANGVSTFYVGNHYEVTNGVTLKYYYFGKQRVAMRTSAGVVYLHSDHLGSTSATSGASVSAQTYYAFGNIRSTTGTTPTDFGFTGQRRDVSAGLMYYGLQGSYGRFYDPVLARFTQADIKNTDKTNPQALNRYTYTGNNPVRFTDPDGHCWPICTAAIGAVVGAGVGAGLYWLNVQSSGQEFNWNEAAVAAGTGTVAGALIGTGVGAPALLAGTATATAVTVATSTGVGIAAGGGTYLASNILFGAKYDQTDFVLSSAAGGATGLAGPLGAGTTPVRAILLNAAAGGAQQAVSDIAHNREVGADVAIAAGASGLGAKLAGKYPAVVSKYDKVFEYANMRWGILKVPTLPEIIRPNVLSSLFRTAAGNLFSNGLNGLFNPFYSPESGLPASSNDEMPLGCNMIHETC